MANDELMKNLNKAPDGPLSTYLSTYFQNVTNIQKKLYGEMAKLFESKTRIINVKNATKHKQREVMYKIVENNCPASGPLRNQFMAIYGVIKKLGISAVKEKHLTELDKIALTLIQNQEDLELHEFTGKLQKSPEGPLKEYLQLFFLNGSDIQKKAIEAMSTLLSNENTTQSQQRAVLYKIVKDSFVQGPIKDRFLGVYNTIDNQNFQGVDEEILKKLDKDALFLIHMQESIDLTKFSNEKKKENFAISLQHDQLIANARFEPLRDRIEELWSQIETLKKSNKKSNQPLLNELQAKLRDAYSIVLSNPDDKEKQKEKMLQELAANQNIEKGLLTYQLDQIKSKLAIPGQATDVVEKLKVLQQYCIKLLSNHLILNKGCTKNEQRKLVYRAAAEGPLKDRFNQQGKVIVKLLKKKESIKEEIQKIRAKLDKCRENVSSIRKNINKIRQLRTSLVDAQKRGEFLSQELDNLNKKYEKDLFLLLENPTYEQQRVAMIEEARLKYPSGLLIDQIKKYEDKIQSVRAEEKLAFEEGATRIHQMYPRKSLQYKESTELKDLLKTQKIYYDKLVSCKPDEQLSFMYNEAIKKASKGALKEEVKQLYKSWEILKKKEGPQKNTPSNQAKLEQQIKLLLDNPTTKQQTSICINSTNAAKGSLRTMKKPAEKDTLDLSEKTQYK